MDHSNPVHRRAISPTDTLMNGLIGGTLAGLGMLASAHLAYGALLGALTRA